MWAKLRRYEGGSTLRVLQYVLKGLSALIFPKLLCHCVLDSPWKNDSLLLHVWQHGVIFTILGVYLCYGMS